MKKSVFTIIFALCAFLSFSQTATKAMQVSQNNTLIAIDKGVDTLNQSARVSNSYLNAINNYVGPMMGYVYTPAYKYEFEWYPGTTTYSVTNAAVMGTLSVTNFSVSLPTGYYKLSYVLLGDIGTSLSAGYNLWLYDSIPQSQTDNVALSNNQTYSKRNLIYNIALTSQIINDSGRLFYNGSAAGYGQTYTSEFLFTGTIYYVLTVAGGTPYANSSSAKNIRLYFKKVAD